jgi:hypothetical protein
MNRQAPSPRVSPHAVSPGFTQPHSLLVLPSPPPPSEFGESGHFLTYLALSMLSLYFYTLYFPLKFKYGGLTELSGRKGLSQKALG